MMYVKHVLEPTVVMDSHLIVKIIPHCRKKNLYDSNTIEDYNNCLVLEVKFTNFVVLLKKINFVVDYNNCLASIPSYLLSFFKFPK
jgi:hypothetical protein